MKKEHTPLILIIVFVIIQGLFKIIAPTIGFMNAEIGGIWFFCSILSLFFLGIYAIIKGNILRKFEETKKIGIITLLVGIVSTILSFYIIIIWIFQAIFGSPFGVA